VGFVRRGWLLISLCAACTGDTAILIEVSSALRAPEEVDALRFEIVGESSGTRIDRRFPLTGAFPHSLSVRALADDSQSLRIAVTGTRGDAFVVRRVVRATFDSGEATTVSVDLTRECVGVECAEGVDCVAGRCDVGVPDGGADAGVDGGGSDAGPPVDAGPECVIAADCDDAVACTVDACIDQTCTHTPVDSICEGDCDPVGGCTIRMCTTAAECDDGDACDGVESCTGLRCAIGAQEACAGAMPVVPPGGRYVVPLMPHSQTGSCGGSGSEAVLSVTIDRTSDLFVATHASSIDTVVYVRACACDGSELGCNDDADGLASSALQLRRVPPGTYNVFVDSKAAATEMVTVDVYATDAGAASDRCGHPTPIAAGATTIDGETCAFTNDYDLSTVPENCPFPNAGDAEDRVFYFHLAAESEVTLSGCNALNTMDTALYVRASCEDTRPVNQVACNDDGCPGGMMCGGGFSSSLTATLSPGLYYVMVDGYAEADWPCPCGNFSIAVTGI
jgi:hypothetical protein